MRIAARRVLNRAHVVLSVLVGVQMFIWAATGLFFAANPIERIRGAHLRADPPAAALDWRSVKIAPETAAGAITGGAAEIRLRMIDGRAVYAVRAADGRATLVDAQTGATEPFVSAQTAARIAAGAYAGRGQARSPEWLTVAPQEYGGPAPAWRVRFHGADPAALYIDAATGEVKAVRTPLWRAYDFLWGLHIMDWRGRENFNSALLILFAGLGVAMAGSGLTLAALRLGRRR